ncbi:hypothetical protein ACFLZB_04100 [Nanoarchaeota archaeon]
MKKVLVIILVFVLGFLANFALNSVDFSGSLTGADVVSPSDWVEEQQVHVYRDKVVLDMHDVMFSSFTDTNSMDPLLDAEANGLEIKPIEGRLKVGDVISYNSNTYNGVVIHRIIEISSDDSGDYYVVKGDNSLAEDDELVRFDQIEGVLVGILY